MSAAQAGSATQAMHGHFDPGLVALSFLVATLAGYTALAIAERVTAARLRAGRRTGSAWLASGAVAMGAGIWSMHFIGMLAFRLPIPVAYDIPLILLSLLVAVGASWLALAVASRDLLPLPALLFAGGTMGVAIAGMHYIGMAAMRVAATIAFDPLRVAASLAIAVVASIAALVLAFRLRGDEGRLAPWRRAGAAIGMGIAVSGMHYMGMAAAAFHIAPFPTFRPTMDGTVLVTAGLAAAVTAGTVFILGVAILGAILDRFVRAQAARAAREGRLRSDAEQARDALAFLSDASAELASSLEYEATLWRVARLAVPTLADYCLVDILDAQGRLRRLAEAHRDPELERILRRTATYYPEAEHAGHPVRAALDANEIRLVSGIDEAWMQQLARSPEYLADLRRLGPRAAIIVPLSAVGQTFGALTFVASDPARRYGRPDVTLAAELTRRAAIALDNARLHKESEAARAEALAANKAKSEFLATMSHELRTPLNAIAGYTELIEMGVYGPVTQAQADGLARIRRSQVHLLGLINQVLSFAKLEVGHLDLHPEDIPVQALLADLDVLVNAPVQFRDFTYSRGSCDPRVTVRADREKLLQILLNLLSNAAKFTAPGGAIAIDVQVHPARVCIGVRDTGRGIPPDKLEAVFEAFVQVEPGLTRQSSGVGLGLPISRALARAMGGDITVESAVGAGSTFTVEMGRGTTRSAPSSYQMPSSSYETSAAGG
jgi:signal transduction histidine kinase/NO-binding membrane sensor protein with MHYT domain